MPEYKTDKKSKAYYNKYKIDIDNPNYKYIDEQYQIYLILPHEYWARFSQFLKLPIAYKKLSFQEVLKIFKESNIINFDKINRKNDRKRLLVSLYKYWKSKQ